MKLFNLGSQNALSAAGDVHARLNFFVPQNGTPYFQSSALTGGTRDDRFRTAASTVTIHDVRPEADRMSVEREGFQLVRHRTSVDDLYDDEAVAGGRIAEINVWRPISGLGRRSPLALADARSVDPDDPIATAQRFPDRAGEIYMVAHTPGQRWCWVSAMTRDEALLIKGWNSLDDGRAHSPSQARFTCRTGIRMRRRARASKRAPISSSTNKGRESAPCNTGNTTTEKENLPWPATST